MHCCPGQLVSKVDSVPLPLAFDDVEVAVKTMDLMRMPGLSVLVYLVVGDCAVGKKATSLLGAFNASTLRSHVDIIGMLSLELLGVKVDSNPKGRKLTVPCISETESVLGTAWASSWSIGA
jgi:hypothetical protein